MTKPDLVAEVRGFMRCHPMNEMVIRPKGFLYLDRLADEVVRVRNIGSELNTERFELKDEIERLREGIQRVTDLVDAQAEDDGLWFDAKTAPEAYLQQELRRLHQVCETRAALHTEADDERA